MGVHVVLALAPPLRLLGGLGFVNAVRGAHSFAKWANECGTRLLSAASARVSKRETWGTRQMPKLFSRSVDQPSLRKMTACPE